MVNTRHRAENRSDVPFLSHEGFDKREHEANGEETDESSGVVDFSPRRLRKSVNQRSTRAATRRRFIIHDDDPTDEESDYESHKKPSPRLVRSVRRSRPIMEEKEEVAVRRSSRQKNLLYGTFDPKILDRALYVDKQSYDHNEDNPRKKRRVEETDNVDDMEESMYSRVKRVRKPVKRDMYGMPVHESSESESSEEEEEENDDEDGDEEGEENNEEEEEEEDDDDDDEDKKSDKSQRRSYYLREHKPRTQLFEVPIEERRRRKPTIFADAPDSPVRRKKKHSPVYRSPAHRRVNLRRKRAFHGSSSTSSSASGSSSDEEHFQRRKAKSMARARNQLLPMNLTDKDIVGTMKDRQRIGASLADIDPMTIDKSVTFDSVGGLEKHIRALKEMVVFPLLYSEVFERFKIAPPRGCLFYGPPGTGKTLVARALANECSKGDKRVAFFMRKGADCLSKWVGESERQLRLLFDQAYQMRPSIIFFDEIDGLAPVRSSRQDQIHSSIVSTLLALMDGLDNRGEVIVIGATNRIDSIDPALRRPGRFDREFMFSLPSKEARRQILAIHTKDWNPKLLPQFINSVADLCVGYCGADLKALCTEAALLALRKRYPQIYQSSEKLQIDVSSISVSAQDFQGAMQSIVPASQRCVASPGKALSCHIRPLLQNILSTALEALHKAFPVSIAQISSQDSKTQSQGLYDDWSEDENQEMMTIYEGKRRSRVTDEEFMDNLISYSSRKPCLYRPRLILEGPAGRGQTTHLGPALLHHMEHLSVHLLDLATMFCISSRTPEEACAHVFREAMRTSPCIVYMPRINQWWDVLSESMKTTLLTTIQNLDPSSAILLLATSEEPLKQLDPWVKGIFGQHSSEVINVSNPTAEERREFFQDLLINQTTKIKTVKKNKGVKKKKKVRDLEVLPKAPAPPPRKLTDKELKALRDKEGSTLRELRIFLREVINKVVKDRKFYIFARPVDIEEVPDYYEVISKPMDLSTMMSKIDMHQYQTGKEFLEDVDLICSNALEYNPNRDTASRAIRHRACALRDTFHAIIDTELDPEFEKQCEDIAESRKRRGDAETGDVPAFYMTKSMVTNQERFSRRVRGLDIENHQDLDQIERQWTEEKRKRSPVKNQEQEGEERMEEGSSKEESMEIRSLTSPKQKIKTALFTQRSFTVSPKKPKRKEVWSYTKRRRFKRFGRYSLPSVKSQLSKKFVKKNIVQKSPVPHTETLQVDVTELENSKTPKSSKSPTVHAQMSPSCRQVKALSPRVVINVSDKKEEIEKAKEELPLNKDTPKSSAMEVDSGISSSVDSNGDSVDSVEQAKQLAKQKMISLNDEETPAEKEPLVLIPETEPDKSTKVVINREALEQLLERVVTSTEGFNVERLQKLYSVFSQCIVRHRDNHDKVHLVQELKNITENCVTSS